MIIHPRIIALGAVVILVLVGTCVFLSTHAIAAPQHKIEKTISNDHLFK